MMRKEKADQAKHSGSEKPKTPPKVVQRKPRRSLLRIAMDNQMTTLALLTCCMMIPMYLIYTRNPPTTDNNSPATELPSEALHTSGKPVLGYRKVSMDNYGYHVSIDNNGKHICGGNIISADYILTAARCVADHPRNGLTVVSGTVRIAKGGIVHKVLEVILPQDRNADIALLKVSPPIEDDHRRQSVELVDAMQKRMPAGHVAFLVGWGRGDHLEVGIEPLADLEVCKEAYGEYDGMGLSAFCAGVLSKENPHGACNREVGSGLIVHGFLTGIFSYGTECSKHRYPGIYVDIAYYRMWIKERSGV